MHILFIVNKASFFISHRIAISRAAITCGFRISLITGRDYGDKLKENKSMLDNYGVDWHSVFLDSTSINPVKEVICITSMVIKTFMLKPDILHTVTPKGNLYGGIAARLCRIPRLVVAVSGQGYLFTGKRKGWKALLAGLYSRLIRWVYSHPNCTVIVQNRDDWDALLNQGLVKSSQLLLIPGSGVDLSIYEAAAESIPDTIVLLPSRLLTDKGVIEFVQAARKLRWAGSPWRFVLAGEADGSNPAAISSAQVKQWVDEGVVEWWGHCSDMAKVFGKSAIVCLPSYREGMPRALLEAAACARPVVTTDVIGCREAIIDGQTGILVPVCDSDALAQALLRLMDDPALRERMGNAGRERAIREFDIESVVQKHMSIYAAT